MSRGAFVFSASLQVVASALLLMTAPVSAQSEVNSDKEIVVTGRSTKDTAADLAACLARNCPPDEDIRASLAHAENQFIGGEYKNARTTLLRSISRNRSHGKQYPIDVSDLFRANSRIAEHVGEAKNFQLSVLDMRNVLKSGLHEKDPRVLVAQIEVGDSRAKLGYPEEAWRIYRDVESDALKGAHNRVAMFARVRQALIAQVMAETSNLDSDFKIARDLLDIVINDPLPGTEDFALMGKVMRARTDRKNGDNNSTDAILRDFADKGGASRPTLLLSEPIKYHRSAEFSSMSALFSMNSLGKWADVGFWINADGRVNDIEVLRGKGTRQWLKPVVEQIKTRIYAPLRRTNDDASPGFYMIERYSLTARWMENVTGTNMRRREPAERIERLDITPENYQQPLIEAEQG